MKKTVTLLCAITFALVLAITCSVAWYAVSMNVDKDINGAIKIGSYFDGGEGTESDPYEISTQKSVYNLAWLQYIGYLDEESENVRLYFNLETDIDLQGMVLPPIGTTEYPFTSIFNGNGHCIKNATISNVDGDLKERPFSATELKGTEIVGFFGVVGDYQGSEKIDTESSIEYVQNLFLEDITVRTESEQSLIGLVAGYVNGSMTNVGVGGTSTIRLGPAAVKSIVPSGETEAARQNVADIVKPIDELKAISLYSLVGAFGKETQWGDMPTTAPGGSNGSEGEAGAGFGGSMDMVSLSKRLTYMQAENRYSGNYTIGENTYTHNKKNYPVSLGNAGFNYTQIMIVNILTDSLIPLNVDTETMFNDEINYTSTLKSTIWYSENEGEQVSDNNTGYIVGGGTTNNGSIIQRSYYLSTTGTYGGIWRSVGTTASTDVSFDRSNFDILTIDKDGKTWLIKDDNNRASNTALSNLYTEAVKEGSALKRFDKVMTNFATSMAVDLKRIHGFRFDGRYGGIKEDGSLDDSAIMKKAISLNGDSYENYALVKSAVNFNLKEPGFITAIAGTFQLSNTTSGNHELFAIYEVKRSENKQSIESLTHIEKVYVQYDADGNVIKGKIKYNDVAGEADADKYQLVYDYSKMNTLSEKNVAYYFEIPVNEGDYIIGTIDGNRNPGAYLMYLDIGANAGDISSGETTTDPSKPRYFISGVNFVDSTVMQKGQVPPAKIKEGETGTPYPIVMYSIQDVGDGLNGAVSLSFTRTSADTVTQTVSGGGNTFTVKKYDSSKTVDETIYSQNASALALPCDVTGLRRRDEEL